MKYVSREELEKVYSRYLVIDHEDEGRVYWFDTQAGAEQWKRDLVECFETIPENVSIIRQEYNRFGLTVAQYHIN